MTLININYISKEFLIYIRTLRCLNYKSSFNNKLATGDSIIIEIANNLSEAKKNEKNKDSER